MKRARRSNRGSATVLIMLIGAVLIAIGVGFNWLVKEHIRASETLRDKTEAVLKARSAFDMLLYLLLNGEMMRNEIIVSGMEGITDLKAIPLDGKEIEVTQAVHARLRDSNGRISLVNVDRFVLERLIRNTGIVDNPSVPVDSLLDWIDEDDLTRLNGAEKDYYESVGSPYRPRNYALQYLEEVRFIRGFSDELWNRIQPNITMLPSAGFNPNTASDDNLKAYLNIGDDAVRNLREYMSLKTVATDAELYAIVGRRIDSEEGIYYLPSFNLDIALRVGEPRNLYTITAGLSIGQRTSSPYTVYYWIEQ
jgi:general secretion pathway protein K